MVAMITQNAYILVNSRIQLDHAQSVKQRILHNMKIGTVVHAIQLERGSSALFISSQKNQELFQKLSLFRQQLDNAVAEVTTWIWTLPEDPDDVSGVDFFSREAFHDGIEKFRNVFDSSNLTITQVLDFYSRVNEKLMDWMVAGMLTSSSRTLWAALVSYHMLIVAKEQAGVERALGSTFYTHGG